MEPVLKIVHTQYNIRPLIFLASPPFPDSIYRCLAYSIVLSHQLAKAGGKATKETWNNMLRGD